MNRKQRMWFDLAALLILSFLIYHYGTKGGGTSISPHDAVQAILGIRG